MRLVRKEYKEYMTAAHRSVLTIAVLAVMISPLSMLLVFARSTFGFSVFAGISGRLVAIAILAGPPIGLILLGLVNVSLGHRHRMHERAQHARSQGPGISAISRSDILKKFPHTTYNYRAASKCIVIQALIMPLALMAFFTLMNFLNPRRGFLVISAVLSILSAPLFIMVSRARVKYQPNDHITLKAEGIQFRENGHEGLIPWDGIQEIKTMQNGYLIESRSRNLIVWNVIEPIQQQRKGILAMMKLDVREPHIVTLMRQINTMNPAVSYLAPEMSKTFQYILAGIFLTLLLGIIITVLLFAV